MADSSTTPAPGAVSSESSPAAYQRLLPKIMQIEGDVHINVDVMYVVTLIFGHLKRILALRDEFVARLKDFDISLLDELDDFTRALQHAHGLYLQATKSPAALQALVERATQLRDVLHADALALATRGLLNPDAFREVKRNNGYRALIVDLQVLVATFRERWADIMGRTAVQAEELDATVVLIDTLTQAVGDKEHSPAAQAQATLVRNKAFLLVVRTWEEVRSWVLYVRRKEGDGEQLAPSLYSNRSSARRGRDGEEQPATEPEAPAPAVPAAVDVAATVAQNGAFKRDSAEA